MEPPRPQGQVRREMTMTEHTTYRVTWRETEGNAITFHDFADEAEARAFYMRLLLTGAIAAMEAR